jgi:D-threo-aldose 1-dehydrogenase
VAMAFPLRHPSVAGVVVGMRSVDEVTRNLAAFAATIPDELWQEMHSSDWTV